MSVPHQPPEIQPHLQSEPQPLQFFNYHEYLVNDYVPVSQSVNPKHQAIVVTNFPNIYAALGSTMYKHTRIVRIPRTFDTVDNPDLVPQFSTLELGKEPAAIIKHEETHFEVAGSANGSAFGATSLTVLSNLVAPAELVDIVSTINTHLYAAFDPYGYANAIESVVDILTATLYSKVFNGRLHTKRHLQKLHAYIDHVNETHDTFHVIQPRLNGYSSLDIRVANPLG
ncbi:ras modification protein erf4 [Yamadazyma tenuis]|uniref:Ras modification protein ERF4 n=1 Tax=Candida tenuis (strain ATCC 10573 / BCRC 21748 / CBS 615 / JCM 9827 / NBRC 10315 / NRRL Y-1498 / VKM Y-70) TaxID=590646 RepID=G3B3C1_CANTC|nr:uncharacterized protein CANTEDRAFT_104714 [Yamadazyma tenuis ATCC 10573]EGV64134.1 hypothetical protein CANTEDRAFT_104714 [Yamadazyma tenuis ATCC 10573]WEJ96230.1 ras modification protein erf4 [Yamadazyma tenuis]